ncbi:YbdK family carboxylate-amine ligase [Leucobacter sp. NPDC058333]|uniref:carboxylate-amine ligase n=1 Tax=Leucobacter sp. NPDC058333 TaxID=3346450 RepID=UPI0036460B9C
MARDELAVRSFGVEEEFLLLDASSGEPVDRAAQIVQLRPQLRREADREFFASQLETASPVCTEAEEADAALRQFREVAGGAARELGAVLAGTGLPPVGGERAGSVTPRERYREIRSELRAAAAHQYVTGTHVHVSMPSRDAGVTALRGLARWAPALLAISANSPIWCGEETGLASWRHIKSMSWPLAGYPPEFAGGDEYEQTVGRLVSTGVLIDPGIVTWVARLSERYPTIELRIADAQLAPEDAVSFALLVRALVDQVLADAEAGSEAPRALPGLVNGAIWMAARDGLSASLVDPAVGIAQPAAAALDELFAYAEGALTRFGDADRVERYLGELRLSGGPAQRQLARFHESGIAGLLDLYRESGIPGAPKVAGR